MKRRCKGDAGFIKISLVLRTSGAWDFEIRNLLPEFRSPVLLDLNISVQWLQCCD